MSSPEVGAVVDARDDEVGVPAVDEPELREAHAVDRRAVGRVADGPVAEVDLLHPQRPARRDPAPDRRPVAVGRDRSASSTPGTVEQRAAQRLQALGVDAVVVGEQHPHALDTSRARRRPLTRAASVTSRALARRSARRRSTARAAAAVGPASGRCAPRSSAANDSSVRRPPATSSIVPTSTRFMLRMNASASISNVEQVAARGPSARLHHGAREADVRGLGRRERGEVVRADEQRRALVQRVAPSSGAASAAPGRPRTGRGRASVSRR